MTTSSPLRHIGEGSAPRREPRDALPAGTMLGGDYRVEHTLGQGGFGIVYLATDLALERPMAIKEYLPVQLAGRGEGTGIGLRDAAHRETFMRGLQSFLREARLLAQFDHPSLVRVYRFWEENHTAYMAMPCYEGPTLKAARDAMLRPPDEAWLREQLLMPLLGALEVLHAGSCLHRDVSPGNILLATEGRPVLLDFGSARRVVGDTTQPLTAILNPSYAAIEQYAESPSLPQGAWTDLYGLGAVAYYALSGRPPTPATVRAVNEAALTPMTEVARVVERNFPGLRYSAPLLAAIDAALAVRPEDRPQTVQAMRELLLRPHVMPDVAVESPPLQAVPPPASAAAADGEQDAEAAATAEEERVMREAIATALGDVSDWPAPLAGGRGQRREPLFMPPRAAEPAPVRRQAGTNKVTLTVVPPVIGQETAASQPIAAQPPAADPVEPPAVAAAQPIEEPIEQPVEQPVEHPVEQTLEPSTAAASPAAPEPPPRMPPQDWSIAADAALPPTQPAPSARVPDWLSTAPGVGPMKMPVEPAAPMSTDAVATAPAAPLVSAPAPVTPTAPTHSALPPEPADEPPLAQVLAINAWSASDAAADEAPPAMPEPRPVPSRRPAARWALAASVLAVAAAAYWAWTSPEGPGEAAAPAVAKAPPAAAPSVVPAPAAPSPAAAPAPLAQATAPQQTAANVSPPVVAVATPATEPARVAEESPPAAHAAPAPRATPPAARKPAVQPTRTAQAPRASHKVSTSGTGQALTSSTRPQRSAADPRSACSGRSNFSLYYCMRNTCRQSRYAAHPQCVKLRESDDVP